MSYYNQWRRSVLVVVSQQVKRCRGGAQTVRTDLLYWARAQSILGPHCYEFLERFTDSRNGAFSHEILLRLEKKSTTGWENREYSFSRVRKITQVSHHYTFDPPTISRKSSAP